jgi:hypothetical protein
MCSPFRPEDATILPEQILGALGPADELAIIRPALDLSVEASQRLHNLNVFDRMDGRRFAKFRGRFDGTGVRGPGGKDSPLFSEGHIGVVDDLQRASERLRWMQELVEVKFFSGPFCHSHMLRFLKDMDTNAAGLPRRVK